MKHKSRAAQPPSAPQNIFKRFKLEVLDQYVCERRGYDPYDTTTARSPDIWAKKHKRA
jgi:hypothetical protein